MEDKTKVKVRGTTIRVSFELRADLSRLRNQMCLDLGLPNLSLDACLRKLIETYEGSRPESGARA